MRSSRTLGLIARHRCGDIRFRLAAEIDGAVPRLVRAGSAKARLVGAIGHGAGRRLSLLSAPAGYGKTTLLSTWLETCHMPIAWLSLDERDNDPTRFLTYIVAALQAIAPNIGKGVLAVLQASQPPPTESILTILLNEIITIATEKRRHETTSGLRQPSWKMSANE